MNKLFITVFVLVVWLLWMLLGGEAQAQGTIVKQGAPGTYGPWPVYIYLPDGGTISFSGGGGGGGSSVVSIDGGTVSTTPQTCTTTAHKVTTVGVAAVQTPSSQLADRRYITLCSSPQNAGIPLTKCRVDGVAPVMAVGNAGDVLSVGDCATYVIPASVTPQCIADTASTSILSYECL